MLLDEYFQVPGYHRKSAIRLLSGIIQNGRGCKRGRSAVYGIELKDALRLVWEASDRLCGKHLTPPMEWVPFTEDPLESLGILIIPAVILGTALSASTMRMTRTMMLEVLRQDYIRTAWAKGLRERAVVTRHAVKNALIPVVTLIGLQLPILVGGAVIMENIFNLPGLGRLMVNALNERDYPVVSGINLVFATAVLGINLMIDMIYPFLDPRVRYS